MRIWSIVITNLLCLGLLGQSIKKHTTAEDISLRPILMKNIPAQWSAYWSPDNNLITYTDWTTTKEMGKEREWNWDIYLMRADGNEVLNLTNHPATDIDSHWSPDGDKLCFSSNRDGDFDIYTLNLENGMLRNVSNTSIDEFFPRWSPDGNKIAYLSPLHDKMEVFVLDLKTQASHNLTNHMANDSDPSWHPSGDKIVFTSDRNGNQEIYEIGLKGIGLRRLTYDLADESSAAYSQDGKFIAFNSDRDGFGPKRYGYVQNYIMKSDGTDPKRISLTKDGGNAQINWSKDDSRLLFSSWRSGNRGIYISNRDGSNEQRISPNPICDFSRITIEHGASTAISLYRKAKLKTPNALFFTGGILERLAFELIAYNRLDEAIEILELYKDEDPENELAQNALLVAYKLKGIDTPPYSKEILNTLIRNFDEGLVVLRELIGRYPGWYLVSAQELIDLSRFFKNKDKMANAILLLELGLEKHLGNTKVLEELSKAYQQIGNRQRAIHFLEQILKIDPDNDKVIARVKSLKKRKTDH